MKSIFGVGCSFSGKVVGYALVVQAARDMDEWRNGSGALTESGLGVEVIFDVIIHPVNILSSPIFPRFHCLVISRFLGSKPFSVFRG